MKSWGSDKTSTPSSYTQTFNPKPSPSSLIPNPQTLHTDPGPQIPNFGTQNTNTKSQNPNLRPHPPSTYSIFHQGHIVIWFRFYKTHSALRAVGPGKSRIPNPQPQTLNPRPKPLDPDPKPHTPEPETPKSKLIPQTPHPKPQTHSTSGNFHQGSNHLVLQGNFAHKTPAPTLEQP